MDPDTFDTYLVLMHRAFRELVRGPDNVLNELGLGRAHHRTLFAIRRAGKQTVGELAQWRGVTNQALHKTLKPLIAQNLIVIENDALDARRKYISLSAAGVKLENRISGMQRQAFVQVSQTMGASAMQSWCEVMQAIEQEALKVEG